MQCRILRGGKDSTVVRELARKAGVTDCYYVDTGLEFPETAAFVESLGIPLILHGPDFQEGLRKNGLPTKDDRWCCEYLKLEPVRQWRETRGGSAPRFRGNRWYESFARAGLPGVAVNPYYSGQLNLSPIRSWRALEVFLYIWWRELPLNPLYEQGFERVGCWMCPAMLESEYEVTRELHPEKISEWEKIIGRYAKKEHISDAAMKCGWWRWKSPPPKMVSLMKERGIQISTKRSVNTQKPMKIKNKR
ncbi:phosphoadenosine phosphosulfate reductase family protein [Methanogenium cariaci]|uniref:phosphoadenosine phosphosulfate reductase domain-containing protein n=1 Tax=Methanogenium cariaci TaxID=2197 RepID=UPI001FE19ED3|nr:phosphoadenosine phosphosulfate reductase family protein [Methanogenium cariaci]